MDFELEALVTYSHIIKQIVYCLNKEIDKVLILKSSELKDATLDEIKKAIFRVTENCNYIDTYATCDTTYLRDAANRLKKILSIMHVAKANPTDANKRILALRDSQKKVPYRKPEAVIMMEA